MISHKGKKGLKSDLSVTAETYSESYWLFECQEYTLVAWLKSEIAVLKILCCIRIEKKQ